MRQKIILCLLVFFVCGAACAEKKRGAQLTVLKMERSATASQTDELIHVQVRVTNLSKRDLPYTNNRFVLTDSSGEKHLVSRPWYAQGNLLAPGQSVDIDRVYFEIPKKRKPSKLTLYWRRIPLGSVDL